MRLVDAVSGPIFTKVKDSRLIGPAFTHAPVGHRAATDETSPAEVRPLILFDTSPQAQLAPANINAIPARMPRDGIFIFCEALIFSGV
jgi:hypothetical protein